MTLEKPSKQLSYLLRHCREPLFINLDGGWAAVSNILQTLHISPDFEIAINVGNRHGKPVVLEISAQKFVHDGYELFRSANGIWQAKAVPPEYFTVRYPVEE